MAERLRVFVPSAAALLTDHRANGEGLVAWRLLTGLAARGHELVVCAREADLAAAPPFELHRLGFASRFESLESAAYARRVSDLFQQLGGRSRFDLVHWVFPTERGELLYRPPHGVPYLVGPVAAPWPRPRRRPRPGDLVRSAARPLLAALERRAWKAASVVLTETAAAAASLPSSSRARARVLNAGVDAARFVARDLPASPRVLFVGRLEPRKGVRELVEAFARVHKRLPGSELVIAGEGPERRWIEERRGALGLNGRVRLLGPVRNDAVPALLEDASVLCLPSDGEPLGNAVLEAMAAGRAVVACDTGGPRELLDPVRSGRLVRPGDADALGEALVELLSETERLAEMGRFNRKLVERELSLERALDRLELAYAEVTA